MTNSQYDDLMDDLNSYPEFDQILAEMLPNSGKNIIPVAAASSAIARSPHSGAVSNVFSCNYQWNAGFQTFPQSKKISNDQELIQSDPISCPQNQKGNN